jgi:osmotically-inducible protein OsmY
MTTKRSEWLTMLTAVGVFASVSLFVQGHDASQQPKLQFNDLQITSHVKAKLASDAGASNMANIDVNTTNGVVTLAGEVENAELKHSVETVTASVLGVVMVSNNLQVGSDSVSVDY